MLTGREHEAALLKDALESEKSEFIAVYGRRRVGKTFLVREVFQYCFSFQHSGVFKGKKAEQLYAFHVSLKDVDPVAYVRFASVYREFKDVNTFMDELKKLLN